MKNKWVSLSAVIVLLFVTILSGAALELDVPVSFAEEADAADARLALADSADYGTLLFGYDFSVSNSTENLLPEYYDAANYPLYQNTNARFGGSSITWGWSNAVTMAVENQTLKLNNALYGQLQFSMLTPATYWNTTGRYTLEYKFKGSASDAATFVSVVTNAGTTDLDTTFGTDGQWTTAAYSFVLDGTTNTQVNYLYIKPDPDMPNQVLFFDDICLYLDTGSVNVTYDFGNVQIGGASTKTVGGFAGSELINPGFCFDHWEDAQGNTVTTVPNVDATYYAVWADDPDLGRLAFGFDFNQSTAVSHLLPEYYVPTVYPLYQNGNSRFDYSAICWGWNSAVTMAIENQTLRLNNAAYGQLQFSMSSPATYYAGEATYTLKYKFKGSASGAGTYASFVTNAGTTNLDVTTGTDGAWNTAQYSFALDGTMSTQLNYVYIYPISGMTNQVLFFDDIELYVKYPPKYTVTLDYNGLNVGGETGETLELGEGDALPTVSEAYPYLFVGWQDANGAAYTECPAHDVTLYAVWEEDDEYGKLRLVYDFNTSASAYTQAPQYTDGVSMKTLQDDCYLWWRNATAIAIDNGAYKVTGNTLGGLEFQFVDPLESGTYVVSYKFKGVELGFVRFGLTDNNGNAVLMDEHFENLTDDFKSCAASVSVGAGTDYASLDYFAVYSNVSVAAVWFDDVKLYEVEPIPESYGTEGENAINYTEKVINGASCGGIRFKASVTLTQRAAASEYGFIVARKTVLGENELTFDFDGVTDGRVPYVSNYAYKTGTSTDYQCGVDDEGNVYFAAFVYNVPADKEAELLISRPYCVTNGVTFYGTAREASVAALRGN